MNTKNYLLRIQGRHVWFCLTCSDCGKKILSPFKPESSKCYCDNCQYNHFPYSGWEKTEVESKKYVSGGWGEKLAILEGSLGRPNSQINGIRSHEYHYQRSKNRHYSEAYLSGLIGEIEGRKWLQENGYQVYEFSMMFTGYFGRLDDTILAIMRTYESMRRRRKQEYTEADRQLIDQYKQGIVLAVSNLKNIFGKNYIDIRRLFMIIKRERKQNRVGERNPDFLATKEGHCYAIEVKANRSKFFAGQVECFELAEGYGLIAKVLKVIVETNKVKSMQLADYKSQLSYYGVNYR